MRKRSSASLQQATPLEWSNLHRWALKTWRADFRHYRRSDEPLSLARLVRTVKPRLTRAVFVVGAPRSGTTFLGELFASVGEFSYHYEPVATKGAARYVYQRSWSYWRARQFYRSTFSWLMRVHLDGHLRLAVKSPENSLLIPFLSRAFPDAQFIHIIRDGRDAALSYSKKPWLQAASAGTRRREPGGYLYGPNPRYWVEPERHAEFQETSDIHRAIWAWRRHTEAALNDLSNLDPSRSIEIRYEDLVYRTRLHAEPLVDFLGIANPLARVRLESALAGAHHQSVGAWRRELSPVQLDVVNDEAGHLLNQLGYVE